jgi:hypothetical protein
MKSFHEIWCEAILCEDLALDCLFQDTLQFDNLGIHF